MTGTLYISKGKYYVNVYNRHSGKCECLPTGIPAVKGRKREAEAKQRELVDAFEKRMHLKSDYSTVWEYIEHWVSEREADVRRGYLDVVTYDGYRVNIERHILPYFKERNIMLKTIGRKDIQDFVDYMSENGRLDGKGGLSPKTIHEFKMELRMIFAMAIDEQYMYQNPCDFKIKMPKQQKKDKEVYTEEEAKAFFEAIKDDRLFPLLLFILITGMRKSEALGLRWQSVDFQRGTLTVEHTVVQSDSGIHQKNSTKNESSHRTYIMSDEIMRILQKMKADEEKHRELFGTEYNENDYVFKWESGTPYRPDFITYRLAKLQKDNNMKHVCVHGLRHSCATILHEKGYSLKDISAYLGHKDIQTTSNIYTHLTNQKRKVISTGMSEAFSDMV